MELVQCLRTTLGTGKSGGHVFSIQSRLNSLPRFNRTKDKLLSRGTSALRAER